ncbi:2Fe-2S iron-sulfur cluster-binding protein [Streptomyces sp. NPDC050264]|uniref:2Fe-2S iron-sulfur cluster-binding protein n=1 Tax=Streptomyces sp. NPDC050264 TaxID=3155038 RepID=UPI00342387DC
MTNEYNGPDSGAAPHVDGWQPLPQGEYDSDATAFVQLPPDGFPDAPLAAPGHGYVPPQITVSPATGAAATDPGATGVWVLPQELTGAGDGGGEQPSGRPPEHQVSWPAADPGPVAEPQRHSEPYPEPYSELGPQAQAAPAPESYGLAQGETGQWSIPVANGEIPDESGEFTTSSLAAQWGDRLPPATLPGGAAAPWASEPWAQPDEAPPQAEAEPGVESGVEPLLEEAEESAEPEFSPSPSPEPELSPEPEADAVAEAVAEAEAEAEGAAETEAPPEREPVPEPVPDPAPEDADEEAEAAPPATSALHDDHPVVSYVLRVNGTDRPVTDAWIGESLLYVLRERLGLAGAKDGCSQGECGACNVQVDGRLVASCLVPAATTAGSEVRTVEGLADEGGASDVQRALAACGAVQCGFCVPGMAMTVHDLLEGNPSPTDLEARQALCGNLCRCSGYRGVLDAVRQVADERRTSVEAAEATAGDGPRIPHQGGPATNEAMQDIHDIRDIRDIRDTRDGGRA